MDKLTSKQKTIYFQEIGIVKLEYIDTWLKFDKLDESVI